jgi:hypothetical protein
MPVTTLNSGRVPDAVHPAKSPATNAPASPPPEIASRLAGGRGSAVFPALASAVLPLLGEATIEAQRTSAVRHKQQQATGDRDVLEEHDHLDLIGEVGVENQRRQQRVPSQQ